ncbi:uncharacterized protein ACWYII_031911 isoform 1-T1 [Salvelinus alpinus]
MNKDRLLGAVSPAPSQLSLKSDHSMDRPITFTNGDLRLLGAVSPAPSQLSLKSDHSMDRPITFTNGDLSVKQERVWSPCLSMKNDCSMDRPITFGKDASGKQERVWSPCLSMKSDCSMDRPITFGKDASGKQERVWSPCLSMKSDWSMDRPITFGKVASELTASLLTEDHFRCSVCTEVLKEPVSIPCGHSYCRQCIETYWNQPDQTGDYDCPQCSKRFRTRPDLLTNSALEKVIEKLHQAGFKVPALPKHCYAGPGDVACDLCSEKQLKAVKSCLTCTASYCESHVRQHYTVAALQRHTLVEVTGNLEQKLCQLHHRALEVFCKTDQVSVCLLCALQDHRNHDVIKNERDTEEAKTTNQGQQAAWRSETKLQRDVQQKKTELTNIIQPEQTLEKATWELTYHTKHFYRGFEAVPTKDWTADSVVVAALGRPLDLGMLYDCRSDSFCSDVCLWNNATIASMQLSLPRTHTEVKCLEGDSLQDRFRALDVTTPLRASVLSGLVEVGGAAGYLKHPVQSTLQDRVTLQYRTTTRLDMLSHSVLQEETDRTQRKATHVVMAVLYGAQAFFIFDSKHINRQRNASREKTKMLDVIKKMLNTFNSEDIFSSLTDSEKVNSLLYQCTLHSDVDSTTTMDYDTAVEVYQSLPKRLGQRGEKAVPVRVWLYPLKNLDHAAACVAFEISEDLLLRAENVLEHLRRVTMRCQDMMSDHTNAYVMKWFPYAKDKLTQFSQSLSEYQVAFQKVLGKATEFIRENGESGLLWFREILKKHDQSPFTPQALDHWLHNKEAEVNAVNICKTKNLPIVKSEKELETVLLDSQTDRVLCFTLTSLEDEDPFLATLKQHTHSVQENTVNQSDLTGQQETQRPFKPPDLTQKILSDLSLFTKSYEDSGDGENIKFIAAVIPDISVPGSSIRLYQQGSLITTNFQLGLKPDPVQVTEIKQSCVLLKFPQSTIRRPERYRVEYRVMTTGVSKVSKWPWNVVDTLAPAETCVVPGLKPFTLYQIRYSVIEHSGMSDFSKVIEVKTLRSPPVQLFVNRLDKETVKVTWLQPECDDGASVLHYKVDYKEAGLEGWSTMVTEGPECKCIITLNLSTCYRVRVSAVYGEGDTSEPSRETDVPVYVWSIDLSKRKASLLLEVLNLQPEKKPVELKGWSDEESEVRSFLQCLPYISQLSFCPWWSDPLKQIKFLVDLLSQAAEWEEQTGEKKLKLVSSVCTYRGFPFPNGGNSEQSDFLLDLYSHVKDYETQTGRSVLPALQPVYQSAPAVWSIDLSERKASLLLEVLKLQPEKKPVELKGWSDEESEVRSFLQCLSYISQLRFYPWRYDPSKLIKFLVDLLSQAAEWEEQTGEKTLKLVSSVCTYSTFPFPYRDNYKQSDFLLDLYSHVKDYETQTGRSFLPALQPVYQSAPAVWSIDLSERKASLLLEVLKLQPEKKPVELKGWSDEESEVRSFLQCLSYISQLSFCPWRSDPSKQIKFLVDLLSQAAEWEEQTGEKTLKLVSSVWTYSTFPFPYGDTSKQSDFLLDLYSHVKDYETQTGRSVLPALQPVYQSAPAVWSIDLSERKASLLLEVLKLQPEKKPVELKGWSDEESEVRSFLQCLSYISQLSCDDDRFFQTVCESIPVRSREEDQQLASLLQFLGSTLSLGGELPRKTCRSVGRVLGLCASRVDLTLTPSKISLKGAALLLRHESKLHKLRLSVGMAVKLSRLVRRTGRGSTPLTVPELSLVLKSSQPPERVLSRALSSVASLLRLWRVQCLDLTDFWIQGHSLIALLCHQGPLSLRLNTDTLQQLTVVVYEAQDKDLTQWFLEKVGGDLTSCRLDWEVLLSLLQHSTHNITVDLRKNRLLEKNISDLLPFLGRVTLKRSSSSFVKSSIRHIYDSRDSDCVSSLLRSSDHWINLNSRELDRVDCTALCFTLQHSHQVKVNLLWTSIPPGEIESILPLLDRVSQLSVDRKLLLSFLQCCAASQVQVGAPSPPIAVWLLRSLHYRLDFSCSSSVDLSAQDPGEALCLTTDHCRAINSVLKQNQHSTQLVQNQVQLILRDCEVEDRALRELLPILHIVKLSPSKALLLQLLDLVCEGIEEGLLRHTESLWRALDGELDLSETRLDQKACGSLALVLEHSEGLSELDLSHCQLTDHHLQALITHLHKVQVLDLSHNDITDALTDRINTHRTTLQQQNPGQKTLLDRQEV